MTSTFTSTQTFTRTHARHLGAKFAADLRQCATLHGMPRVDGVEAYLEELVELLVGGYVSEYEFGFKQNDRRILCWRYVITSDGSIDSVTGDPGGLYARDVAASARYYNYLSYSSAWWSLDSAERQRIKDGLPVRRSSGSLPGDGDGYWHEAREYGAGGVRVTRREFRPL